ncbi:MAG: N(4)-(beta-N-acetylglucosaminyl)-L-asparaginase [Rhodothermia bacterium]|nr:MAG: N(4)-(beta-N-acetylglucosaminyl)-L-asparaginase [Rhodothermia bacterium]
MYYESKTEKNPMATSKSTSRREFLKAGALAGIGASVIPSTKTLGEIHSLAGNRATGPLAVSSRNGQRAVLKAIEVIQTGSDAIDAVIAGVNLVEEDPNDSSVGYGGLPNEEGVVQLDSSVMHGPTGRAGGVGAIEGIMYPSKVAHLVLQRTDHVLLVGKGAQKFATMHGFEVEDLLTDSARERWVKWKENLSNRDDYLPPHDPSDKNIGQNFIPQERHMGTIHCSAIDLSGNISGVTTTSGLSYKIPGRVGDSPIIGAGCYVDNEVGSAGSTGRGEANLENLSCFLIVERMRMGDSPQDASLFACQRIVDHTRLARLQDDQGRPNFNVKFYSLNADGVVGGAEIWGGESTFYVADANGSRLEPMAYLYKRA